MRLRQTDDGVSILTELVILDMDSSEAFILSPNPVPSAAPPYPFLAKYNNGTEVLKQLGNKEQTFQKCVLESVFDNRWRTLFLVPSLFDQIMNIPG
ncbi:hypothetical protein Clacol_004530 [Clathrus columnatus]|uniref:Uncharacterized protein n=1 Tax=Clathrus columnatus TaxID=1419009 RepID=A0AAV5A6P9_9AGAM|nr:hypothetical protein Clacol_004530 [Clathrus columnatus]